MTSDVNIEFSYNVKTNDDSVELLDRLKRAVTAMEDLLADENKAHETYKAIRRERERLSDEVIPEMMLQLGLDDSLYLADGRVIKVRRTTRAGIRASEQSGKVTDEEKSRAYEWLMRNGEEGIFKKEVSVSFLPHQDVGDLEAQIRELGFVPNTRMSVHHSTLQARLRRLDEEGVDLPADIFNVWPQAKTKVTRKK